MTKPKDFYGKDVTEAIGKACAKYSVSQDAFDIDILETGSAGIFGLCRKKAHIRVTLKVDKVKEKPEQPEDTQPVQEQAAPPKRAGRKPSAKTEAAPVVPAEPVVEKAVKAPVEEEEFEESEADDDDWGPESGGRDEERVIVPPSAEVLESVRADIDTLLELMGFKSDVEVAFVEKSIQCTIRGDHEEQIIGPEGRTLDSLQYLIRKMVNRRLPDRMALYLDAGNYRERRIEDLRQRALEMAALVKEDGKTQAIPALNPSERRVVHMVLQDDKAVRSRSVGEGLFKKVLIYKPGKGRSNKPATPRKRRGRPSGRSNTNDQ